MINWLSGHRVFLGWVSAAIVLYLAEPTPPSLLLGIPLCLIGLFIRAIGAGTLLKQEDELTQVGIYACTRNPLYLGSGALTLGFAIMSGSVAAAAVLLVPSALVYPLIIRNEEADLRVAFGEEFDRFRARVPCFLPRQLPPGILRAFKRERFMRNCEYNAPLGFIIATSALALKYLLTSAS